MNEQQGYEMLVSIENYLLAGREYRALDVVRWAIDVHICKSPAGSLTVNHEASQANLDRWQYVRELERTARKAVA